MREQDQRLLYSLRQQLAYEITFVKNVSRVYRDAPNKLEIVDFDYKGMPCKLVLNGKIMLETKQGDSRVETYQDLMDGLIQSNYSKKRKLSAV